MDIINWYFKYIGQMIIGAKAMHCFIKAFYTTMHVTAGY